jgi:hypothetical protein
LGSFSATTQRIAACGRETKQTLAMISRWFRKTLEVAAPLPPAETPRDDEAVEHAAALEPSTIPEVVETNESNQIKSEVVETNKQTSENGEISPSENGEISPELMKLQQKERILVGQKEREIQASLTGSYVKNQRVRYLHKASQTWYHDAYIVSVHHDDGTDHPYYTIRYNQNSGISSVIGESDVHGSDREALPGESPGRCSGTDKSSHADSAELNMRDDQCLPQWIEKQTTDDRLAYAEWDAERTWKLLDPNRC